MWAPWLSFNHVPEPIIGPTAIAQAREAPAHDVLDQIGQFGLLEVFDWRNSEELVEAAEHVLAGRVELPGFTSGLVPRPQGPAEMASGPTMWQLFVHSLGLPRVLVEAYKSSGRVAFIRGATDYLIAYDAYERAEWTLPGGYLWQDAWRAFVRNDHAIAARAMVLIEFWRIYRSSPEFDPEVANAVLRMAARCAYLLSDPRRFTVATNHGVMQNLALCSLGLSFPTLPGAEDLCGLAFRRLDEQLAFFINDEGFMLEHSPGYQRFSLRLIGIAFRLKALFGQPVPEEWNRKYRAAQRVYAALRRPDGSMPMFGDTDGGPQQGDPLVARLNSQGVAVRLDPGDWTPDTPTVLAPVAGYGLWWDGLEHWPDGPGLNQTSVAWSYFPGMGHKHADEPSLSIWAAGTPWLDNVGYWSYDAAGRETAESWAGSNAPHYVGEPATSERETSLRYHGRGDKLAAIDLERVGPNGYRTRRQVIHIGQCVWIVIDTSASIPGERVLTIWTTAPAIDVSRLEPPGAYRLVDQASGGSLLAYFLVDNLTTHKLVIGSESPFAGWRVLDGTIRKAPSFLVERPANSLWTLSAWSVEKPANGDSCLTGMPEMRVWRGPDEWQVMLPGEAGRHSLTRNQERIVLTADSGTESRLTMEAGFDVVPEKARLRASLTAAAARYGTTNMSGVYRVKVTVVLLLQLLASRVFLHRMRTDRNEWLIGAGALSAAALVLTSYYFIAVRTPLV